MKTGFWRKLEDGTIECTVCPRGCKLREGQRGMCFSRVRQGDQLVLSSYGRSSGLCIDPVEKKPLYHFLPGTPVLSFGTTGCNLSCSFCQNWDISKSQEVDALSEKATPAQIADAAIGSGSQSVAFTYNDPVVFFEYAIDVADECRSRGIKTIAVTNGYMQPEACEEFYKHIDAANVDLKSFSEDFYKKICAAHLAPVLECLKHIRRRTNTWLEITTLLIPGANDSEKEITQLTAWIAENLGVDVPLHFTAFHPAYKMLDKPPTPLHTLVKARRIALYNGLRYVYTGNVRDTEGSTTFCYSCGDELIVRESYEITKYNLTADGQCKMCGTPCDGIFSKTAGDWGAKRVPILL